MADVLVFELSYILKGCRFNIENGLRMVWMELILIRVLTSVNFSHCYNQLTTDPGLSVHTEAPTPFKLGILLSTVLKKIFLESFNIKVYKHLLLLTSLQMSFQSPA